MEHASELNTVEPEQVSFDAIEIAGLVVPLLLAAMTIVLVALNPNPAGTAPEKSEASSERLEQIQRR